jgi:hypothetical protein
MMDFLRRCLTLVVAASVALTIGAVASRAGTPTTRAARSGGTLSTASVAAPTRVLSLDNQRRIDINNLNMFVNNYGGWAYDQATGNSGVVYPKGTDKTAVFASGLWFGAMVDGSVRTEVGEYSWEYGPGRILADPLATPGRPWEDVDSDGLVVFKVRRWTGDPADSAHVERAVDASDGTATDPLVHHSWSEYMAGAVPRGAPWKMYRLPNTATVDVEDDSLDVPGPDVAGDQMLWSIYNDANPAWHTNSAGNSAPLGLQIRQTTFAFDRSGALGNTIFLKFEIIHPHLTTATDDVYTKTLEDMYVSLWADVDLGGSSDDLAGCDTTLSLGFTYNATNNDQTYGKTPPVVGYDFFLGPRTTGGDTLGMTSFNKYINGTDPASSDATYSYMQGLLPDGSDLVDPTTGLPTHYFNSGDPVLGTGWLDNNAADKRMMLSSGPFSMEPGDTQIVVAALIIGQGSNRLSSVAGLRFYDTYAQDAFDKAFDLPSPPSQPKVEVTVDHGTATLCWDAASRLNYHVPGYAFEGYNVYQGETVAGPWKLLATYDEVDAVRVIYDEIFDLTTGQTIPAYPTAFGSDLGVAFCHTVTEDAIRGGTLKDGTNYYYAVTAYSYNPSGKPKVLETSQVPVTVMPQRPALGTDPGTASATDVTYTQLDPSQPPSTEVVSVQVVNPADVTGHGYRVTFEPMDPLFFGQIGADTATARYSWTLTDTTAGEVRLTGQLNQRGDVDYRVVDGIQVTVAGAYFPVLQTVSYQNTDATHYRALEGYTNWSGNQDWFYGAAGPAITYWPNSSRLDPAADPDSFTTVRLVYTEPRQGQKAYRFFRRELADSTSAGDVGDAPPTGIGYVYGGFHRINLWAIDAVSGDTLDIAWCERMKTDSVGTYLPDDRQPSCQDSLWTPEPSTGDATLERLFVEKSRYSETDTMPKALYTGATNPGALRQGILPGLYMIWAAYRAAGDPADPMQDRIIDPGDAIRFTWAVPATSNDVYTFDTSPLVRGNAALARTGLGRIRVVPNPYYNRSTYELSQFNRMIRFINLPEQCTIRIFSLSGELIRTLRKTDATSSVFTWNVQTENGLPVASGVYVYHVDAPGVGSTYGRLVVFMEKERLNTY